MKPILSISSAILSILGIMDLGIFLSIYLSRFTFIIFIIIILGGGIATGFSTGNKIRYSVYYGILSDGVLFAMIWGFLLRNCFLIILIPIIAGVGGLIAKNEKDTIKHLLNNNFQNKHRDFLISLYKRNKMFLIVSLVLFSVSVVIGGIGTFLSSSFNPLMTNVMVNYLSGLSTGKVTTLSIFLDNSTIAVLYDYIGGISFGIIIIMHLARLGLIFGFTVVKSPVSILYLLPQGIFEFSGYVIAVAAGFKLLSMVINIIWDGLHIKRDIPIADQVKGI